MRLHRSPHSFDPLNKMEQDGDADERWPPSSSSRQNAKREDIATNSATQSNRNFTEYDCVRTRGRRASVNLKRKNVFDVHAAAFCVFVRC